MTEFRSYCVMSIKSRAILPDLEIKLDDFISVFNTFAIAPLSFRT